MKQHSVIEQYLQWKKDHPDEGYQYDEIHEFFATLSRGDMQSFMEWATDLSQPIKQ